MNWLSVPGTTVDFELKDGSEFVLDTRDEVELQRVGRSGTSVNGAWFHGMVTEVEDEGISCGFVARDVHAVRDVRLDTDVVILEGRSYAHTSKYEHTLNMWKTRGAPVYKAKTGALLEAAVKKWQVRELALNLITGFQKTSPRQLGYALPEIVPEVTACMWDTKKEIKVAATTAMTASC